MVHVRAALEFERSGSANPDQTRTEANCWERTGVNVFVQLLATDAPVFGKLRDRHIGFGMRFKIVQHCAIG